MKNAVLDFLKNDTGKSPERFNAGYQLLLKSPGANNAMLRNYNTRGYTPQSLETLVYDLKKLHGVSDLDIRNHTVTEVQAPVQDAPAYDQKLFAAANKDAFSNILKDMNDEQKTGLKLATQYPFLRDPNLPNEFKILTNDALTAFHNFREAHNDLFEKVVKPDNVEISNDDIYSIASGLLADFEMNRDIHAELEHFGKTGEILGEHEIFADLKRKRLVEETSDVDLKQKIRNLSAQISKAKGALKKAKADKKKEITEKIEKLTADKAELEKIFQERQNP